MFSVNSRAFLGIARVHAVRAYQIPATKRTIIPIYPAVEKLKNKNSVIYDISKTDIEKSLDPEGWRRRLLNKGPKDVTKGQKSADRTTYIETGDIVRITYDKSKCDDETFLGYVLGVYRKNLVQDSSLLLRNQVGKTFVEVRVPIFSPLIQSIDILKKCEIGEKRRKRSKHYYIRGTKLDVGELELMLRKKR
ncbi:hypothetical protein TPHA_0D03780 [Tetrapisispora phaffii CBS 4417]|uniref:KOW domain-containing protein n=1 Tax=Tetrapisispora phaffii (strain ATCC 24235 / CBS 4417 / NBRC 1672 / NRRL Y-8282 / UCD 70-5) TaxID=1071381 RepID=G8BT40_TETPH|nr:mitochondrial 54S ribosomal protein IMG1 TPHA_0D03780 [Tetrapisispora phaffii CBS 4417]CCE63011.1 hypothetical protein TPHA_0D03780 [Tetrapisispora phaffii CBS 4417]